MEGEELRAGKARVKRILIDPLVAAGMVRKPSLTVAAFEAQLENLQARLAYMSDKMLEVLAEMVERGAGGKARNIWPVEVTICAWARALQPPPPSESRLVRSYLQSAAGRMAAAEGYLLELYDHLKRTGTPPTNDWAIATIRKAGAENQRRRKLIIERAERGASDPADDEWRRNYDAALARVESIMAQDGEVAA